MNPKPAESVYLHDAFVSYSRKDKDFARTLTRALEAYRPPKDLAAPQRNLEIFRDEEDFTGVEYFGAVEKHLKHSRRLILLCSPNSRASKYVAGEIETFAAHRGPENIVPLLVSGIPNNEAAPETEDQKAFPEALTKVLAMPLAGNYLGFDPKKDRIDRGRHEGAWYTLLANLYGVSRNEIEDRDRKRQLQVQRRRLSIAASVIGVLLVALVATAFFWREAANQANIAQARLLAARAQILGNESDANLVTSVLLAVESLRRHSTPEGHRVLRPQMALLARPVRQFEHGPDLRRPLFSQEGGLLATVGWETIVIWDAKDIKSPVRLATITPLPAVNDAAFDASGRLLATGSGHIAAYPPTDMGAQVWDARSGRELARIPDSEPVNLVALSPDGELLVTASFGGMTRLWQASSGKKLAEMPQAGSLLALDFNASGTRFATLDNRGNAKLWNREGTEVATLRSGAEIKNIGFRPGDQRQVFTFDTNANFVIWDEEKGAEVKRTPGRSGLEEIAVSSDGAMMASMDAGDIAIWETDGFPAARIAQRERVFGLTFSPSGKHLLSESADGTVRVWTLDGKEANRIPADSRARSAAMPRDNSNILATAGSGGIVNLWELTYGAERKISWMDGGVESAEYSGNGQYVLSSNGKNIVSWNAATGEKTCEAKAAYRFDELGFAPPDGGLFGFSRVDEQAELRETATCSLVGPISNDGNIKLLAYSRDGRLLAASDANKVVTVWELPALRVVSRIPHENGVGALDLSTDGNLLATVGLNDFTARIWDTATGAQLHRIDGKAPFSDAAFAANNRYLILAEAPYGDNVIAVDAGTGKEVRRFRHEGGISQMSVVGERGLAITAGFSDGYIRVWDVAGGVENSRLPQVSGAHVFSVGPDGRHAAVANYDGTARVWDIDSGQELIKLAFNGAISGRLGFSPDGRHLVTGGVDGSVRTWFLRDEDLIAETCRRLPRNLTRFEWSQYVGEEEYRPVCPDLPLPAEPVAEQPGG